MFHIHPVGSQTWRSRQDPNLRWETPLDFEIAPPTVPVTAPPQACETVGLKVRQESELLRFSNRNVGLSWVGNLVGLVSEAVLQ